MKNIILHLIWLVTIAPLPASYAASNSSSSDLYQQWKQRELTRQLQKAIAEFPQKIAADQEYLDNLYKSYEKNPQFCKTEEIDFDYALRLLSNDIEKLEKQSSPEHVAAARYIFISLGLFISTTSFLYFGGLEAIFDLFFHHWELIRGRFDTIYLPASVFEKLKSSKVSFKEKKYLKRFRVNEVCCNDTHWYYNDSSKKDYYSWSPHQGEKLSVRDKDKLKYIALRNEIQKHKSTLKSELYSMAIRYLKFLACGIPAFYLAYIIPKDTTRKLKAAQELHDLLTQERERRLSLSPKKI
jgi:hypothetical protein